MTSASSSVSPDAWMRRAQRSCCAAATRISCSAASWPMLADASCSAVMVSVGGELGTDVLEHSEHHRSGGGFDVIAGERSVAGVVGSVDSDVGQVRMPAASKADIQVLPCHGRVDQDVGGVDGDVLCSVGGDGVAEVEVFGRMAGRGHHRPARSAGHAANGEGPSSRTSVTIHRSPLRIQPRPERRQQSSWREMTESPTAALVPSRNSTSRSACTVPSRSKPRQHQGPNRNHQRWHGFEPCAWGGPGRARTDDRRGVNALLYQLSYRSR